MRRFALVALLLCAAVLPPASGNAAIVIRHDLDDADYLALGNRYASVLGHFEERAESTLVAPRWALTAAHVVDQSGPFDAPYVIFGGERYRVEKIILHPEWEGRWDDLLVCHDLALVKLDRPVEGADPVRLYAGDDEHGQVVTLLGRGKTGTGITGAVGEKGHEVRGATNRVDGVSETVLLMVFDEPNDGSSGEATELEGQAGSGDSGGPALLDVDGTVYLAGVGSAGTGGGVRYGTVDMYVRVSTFKEWIEETIAADPPPTTEWARPVRYRGAGERDGTQEGAPFPDTPAGRAAAGFRDALSTGTVDALTDFFVAHGTPGSSSPEGMADRVHAAVYEQYGVPGVHGWSVAGPYTIRVLFESADGDTWRSFGLELSPEPPHEITRVYLKWESPPKTEVWG